MFKTAVYQRLLSGCLTMEEGLGGLDVRSPHGHAAFSMQGLEGQWERIQMNTFQNWVNDQLRSRGVRVDDLAADFCDGIKLCALVEDLQVGGAGSQGGLIQRSYCEITERCHREAIL